MGMNIAGCDLRPAAGGNHGCKTLAAGCRAAVQNVHFLLRQLRTQDTELCRRILYIIQTLPERCQLFQITGAAQHQTVLHPFMGYRLDGFLRKACHQRIHRDLQGVHLNHRPGCFIVGPEHIFNTVFSHIIPKLFDQLPGMGVPIFQRGRLFQAALGFYSASEHTVHKSRGIALLFTVFLRQIHALVHSGAGRNFVHFIDLIQTQMENIMDHRMQVLHFAGEQLLQIEVQLVPVLQHTVAEPGSQSRIPTVQPVTKDILLHHTVGPGPLRPAGDQRIQRCFSGAHLKRPADGPGSNPVQPYVCRLPPAAGSLPPHPHRRQFSGRSWSDPGSGPARRSLPRFWLRGP